MTKLRIGVIGAGSIAAAHLDAYAAHPDVELIAVADINLDRARAVADRYGAARAYDDAHDLLAADDIDGVSICTWNDTHAVWATAAIEAGKHVLVEKPLSRTVAEALAVEQAAAASDREGRASCRERVQIPVAGGADEQGTSAEHRDTGDRRPEMV